VEVIPACVVSQVPTIPRVSFGLPAASSLTHRCRLTPSCLAAMMGTAKSLVTRTRGVHPLDGAAANIGDPLTPLHH
jgi:hypothetical protein